MRRSPRFSISRPSLPETPKEPKESKEPKTPTAKGRPKEIDQPLECNMKLYFSRNISAIILLTSNYVHRATHLLQMYKTEKQCHATTTFYFYENFFVDANYKRLPELPSYPELNQHLKRMLGLLMVTMPRAVFDEFLKIMLRIIGGLQIKWSENAILQSIWEQIDEYPYLTFRKTDRLEQLGYSIWNSRKTIDGYFKDWLNNLLDIVNHEMRQETSPVFDVEFQISQKISNRIPWRQKQTSSQRQKQKQTSFEKLELPEKRKRTTNSDSSLDGEEEWVPRKKRNTGS